MIRHIVMWKLRDENKAVNALEMRHRLEGMRGKVAGLRRLEVGISSGGEGDDCDLVLYSEFDDEEALREYQAHPEHKAIGEFVKTIRVARHQVDHAI